jgi:prevent-host-death family protein
VIVTTDAAMEKVIRATEANQQFSRILREVAEGNTFTVTTHGRPIARIVPAQAKGSEAAKRRLLEHLRSQPAVDIGPWTREELYDC